MDTLGIVHMTFGSAALALGMGVVALKKGTRIHRTIGHLYFSSMIGLNVTALSIYKLFGVFGPFHALALVSLGYVIFGVMVAVLRRPRRTWVARHAKFMLWSYVGLWAAAVSEITARVPGWNFWIAVAIPSTLVAVIGGILIHTRAGAIINRLMQREQTAPEMAATAR